MEGWPAGSFVLVERSAEMGVRDRMPPMLVDPHGEEYRRLSRSLDRNARLAVIPRCTAYSSLTTFHSPHFDSYGDAPFVILN